MEILTKFDYAKVRFDQENLVSLMASFKAPTIELETERQPLNLVAILDISGSMGCSNKLESMKRTASTLVDHLSERDQLGIVIFSTAVSKLASVKPCTAERKEELKQRISNLTPHDLTNISGATLLGYELMQNIEGNLNRLLLLTDGLPNQGVSDLSGLVDLVKNRPKGITLSTFGFGTDHDPELLQSMAKAGDGNFYFIENADAINTAFAQELGGLLTCYAQNICLKITPKPGVEIDEILNDAYEYDIKEKETEIRIPDMFSEELKNVSLKVKLEPRTSALPRKTCIAKIKVSFTNLMTKKTETIETNAKIEFVKPGEESTERDKEVKEAEAILEASKTQAKAIKMANMGNFTGAQVAMANCCNLMDSIGTLKADELGAELQEWTANLTNDKYNSSVGYLGTQRAYSYSTGRASGQSVGSFTGTEAQKRMQKSFEDSNQASGGDQIKVPKKEDKNKHIIVPGEKSPPKKKKKSNRPFSGKFLDK